MKRELIQSSHRWDYSTSVPEVMQALDALVKQNKVLYLGISDTPGKRLNAVICSPR